MHAEGWGGMGGRGGAGGVCVGWGGMGGSIQLRCLIQIEGRLLLHRQCETRRGGMFYSVIVFPITACNSSVVGITP